MSSDSPRERTVEPPADGGELGDRAQRGVMSEDARTSSVSRLRRSASEEGRDSAIAEASIAVQRGELVIVPTDTVYGIAADAFNPDAVANLRAAKGHGRAMPPTVMIGSLTTLDALATRIPAYARQLVAAFWPGPLTIVCNQQASIHWDLGETRGTVCLRVPDRRITLELLERTGPLAVTSASRAGRPAANDASQAEDMLGEEVAVIIDDGPVGGGLVSTIVDVRNATGKLLRRGAISLEELNGALSGLGACVEDAD